MWLCRVKYLESPHQQCLGLSLVVSVTMYTCWSLQTLTGVKLVNTNVKPVTSVAMQQRQQLLMCSVSTCKSYPLLHVVSRFSLSQYIDLLLCHIFDGKTCLFVALASAKERGRFVAYCTSLYVTCKGQWVVIIVSFVYRQTRECPVNEFCHEWQSM